MTAATANPTRRAAVARTACVALAACAVQGCGEAASTDPHYVLGRPYQAGGVWFYPREAYNLDETGVAAVVTGDHAGLTTDGEASDQGAVAAAHPTVQLPAIARLTNLENGLQVTVRLNDRGTGDPHRLVEVTRRTAGLLGMAGQATARVRLQVLPGESQAAADAVPGAPRLAINAAPRGAVAKAELPAPAGVRALSWWPLPVSFATGPAGPVPVAPPMRLAGAVVRTAARPGRLMVRLDTFGEFRYAAQQQAKMTAAGARVVAVTEGGTHQFRVEAGPFQDVAGADAVLDQAFARGIRDARIVVD